MTIRGLKDNQVARARDLDAQIPALSGFRRYEEQCLAGAIRCIACIDNLFRAGHKAQRHTYAFNRLGRIIVRVDDDDRQLPLRRALCWR